MDAVFGATGFLGRWTVLHLLGRGRQVAAVVRAPGGLRDWLLDHGADVERLLFVTADITAGASLGLSAEDDRRLMDVREVFNAAAIYRFGLSREQAQAVNVDGAVNVVRWAGTRPNLRTLIHVSGYRVGLDPEPRYPLPEAESAKLYRSKGAYEGSKTEADAAVRVLAAQLGIPLTVVNPSSVIGHSTTGEAGQYLGLAELVRDLWTGKLPALPGTARTFVPVVTVDYFAEFMATLTECGPGDRHWVLDEKTPDLPKLVRLLAEHLGVRAPKFRVPVGLVRRLPSSLTGANPETLTFLAEDRYDTESARAVGLRQPPVEIALRRWADRLVADGFGATPAVLPGGFHDIGGARTYVAGDRSTPKTVVLQGIPFISQAGQDVPGSVLVADPPGLGRSGPAAGKPEDWLAELLAPVRSRPILIAHSVAAAPALRYAAAQSDRIAGLVLVAPHFLHDTPLAPRTTADQPRRADAARDEARWTRTANDPTERRVLRVLATETGAITTPDFDGLPQILRSLG
ncbi:alpha/beta fold hydrolase [Amycolatopsis magusensis]|uniref:alpha/beta fold hydrolase n=1 Tax=Amycolatopsis magusensis TaxID=882444 RepID=UPI003C2C4B4A